MTEVNKFPLFFMCANSAEGFVEHFSDAYKPEDGWHTYIIKGGPGTGKSTAMKKIASLLRELGEIVHLSPCTADPDSLDAVILPERKIMIVDGTAPHVIEPVCIGACEHIVDFGESFDISVLAKNRDEIIKSNKLLSNIYKSVYRYISAAGSLLSENMQVTGEFLNIDKVSRYAHELAEKYLPKKCSKGSQNIRFLSGISCDGLIYYRSTIQKMGCYTIALCDEYATCAPAIIKILCEEAVERGYDILACKNPLFPSTITDHLLIPELKLAFITSCRTMPSEQVDRKIDTDSFLDMSAVGAKEQILQYNQNTAESLLAKATTRMAMAKAHHDVLEQYYIEAVDFNEVNDIITRLQNQILDLIGESN